MSEKVKRAVPRLSKKEIMSSLDNGELELRKTLEERDSRYGSFIYHARITQQLKDEMRGAKNWPRLTASQRESLEMIAHKIGRILNGDPNYADSWIDIAGYAQLVVNILSGKRGVAECTQARDSLNS